MPSGWKSERVCVSEKANSGGGSSWFHEWFCFQGGPQRCVGYGSALWEDQHVSRSLFFGVDSSCLTEYASVTFFSCCLHSSTVRCCWSFFSSTSSSSAVAATAWGGFGVWHGGDVTRCGDRSVGRSNRFNLTERRVCEQAVEGVCRLRGSGRRGVAPSALPHLQGDSGPQRRDAVGGERSPGCALERAVVGGGGYGCACSVDRALLLLGGHLGYYQVYVFYFFFCLVWQHFTTCRVVDTLTHVLRPLAR